MNLKGTVSIFFQYIFLSCAFIYCSVLASTNNIEEEGLLPVYSTTSNGEEVGSGDVSEETIVLSQQVKDCDCIKYNNIITTKDPELFHKPPEPLIVASTPSFIIVLLVIISLLLLVSIAVIVYLVSKIKYLNMRQSVPVPKSAEDYDSDEYSVMMDWIEPDIIVKPNKQKIDTNYGKRGK